MLKFRFTFLLPLVFSTSLMGRFSSAGPIIVGTGAGQSEYSIIFVESQLTQILRECADLSCQLSPAEKTEFLPLVLAAHTPRSMLFKTENEMHEDIFRVTPPAPNETSTTGIGNGVADGVANVVGNSHSIWFNQSRLWLDAAHTRPYDVGDAAALWLDVLAQLSAVQGAPLSAKNAFPNLSLFKERIARSLRGQVERSQADLDDGSTFELLNWHSAPGNDRLLIRDPALQSYDTTDAIKDQITAQVPVSKEPLHLQIFSPLWVSMISGETSGHISLRIGFALRWTDDDVVHRAHGFLNINAERNEHGVFEFLPLSLKVNLSQALAGEQQ